MVRVAGWIPRKDREPVSFAGLADLSNGREVQVTMTNISGDGCEIQLEETLMIGSTLALNLPSFEKLKAKVRWSLCGRAGLRFETGNK